MAIKEESFRIGCGRYLQGAGYIERAGEEVCRVGASPLVIGDSISLSLTKKSLEKSLGALCGSFEFIEHNGTCNDERAKELAAYCRAKGYDVLVGTGGGVIMDFAKLCAHFAALPVVNIPTSAATCAACTPLSVRYTPEGKTVGSLHFKEEVNAVICDMQILSAQPPRLLLAGVFDALAKFVEIKQRFTEGMKEFPLGLDYAYIMSGYSYRFLNDTTQKCLDDMEKGEITEDVERLIFTTIAATGVISGIARGSNQTALAHKFYETARLLFPESTKPYLHGEIVGVGLLLQNHFNGEEENNTGLLQLMKNYDMPCCPEAVGIDRTKANLDAFYEKLCGTTAIETAEDRIRLQASLNYFWRMERQ